ncbi:sensor histidine kinase N-terminal domain-containing protein [Methylolobus aquaticus]
MRSPTSLRTQLLTRLALPMAVFVMLDAGVSYFVALHYANVAYDRWLLDSARSLAQEVKAQKGRVVFELPPTALEVFQWDEVDKTFFKIESSHLGFMAGDRDIPAPPDMAAVRVQPLYFDSAMRGLNVRVVSMAIAPKNSPEEVIVQVAETVNKRRGMTAEILAAVLVPQLLLVLIGGLHVSAGINRGLRPLHALTREIAQRSPRDLAPIPDTRVPLEVRSLTHTINGLLSRLSTAMATQQRFIANAAHQFRTPVAALKVQVERTLREPDLDLQRTAMEQIKSSAERISRLTSQLLALARSEATLDAQFSFQPVQLTDLAREVCLDWAPKALRCGVELGFDAGSAPLIVVGDAHLLRELMHNLLENALLYGSAGGQIEVRLAARPNPELMVENDGSPVPRSERERVFERFYRVPGTPGEGCGLGLAIVREIADLHQADVRIGRRNRAGGTRVRVRFKT